MEETSTFLGLDNNRLCRWDLRDARGKVAESPIVSYQAGKDYSRGTNFNCMATSGDGFVVIGSQVRGLEQLPRMQLRYLSYPGMILI